MGDLTNKQISQTFDGLIKTSDEQPIDGTLKTLQDGVGNNLPVEVSTTGVNFTGNVTGIDTGVQSVVAGTNVTVDNTDPANPIVSAAGGGGGSTPAPFVSYSPGQYDGSNEGPYTFFTNSIVYYAISMHEGQNLTTLDFEVTQAFANSNIGFAVYSTQKTTNANGPGFAPHERLIDLGSVSGATTGVKELSGFSFDVPYTGAYYIGVSVPNVWDGALGGYSISASIGGSDTRVFNTLQYGGIPGSFYGQFAQLFQTLRDVSATFPASYASNKAWSSTSAYVFTSLRTN